MKHHKTARKFGRTKSQRQALLRSLARSLVLHGRIQTTEAKAKELRPFVERLVTHAQKGTHAAQRRAVSFLGVEAGGKLFSEIAPRYAEQQGGYTRVIKLPPRQSDAAKQAIIEFVS